MNRTVYIDSLNLNFVGSRYLREKLKREYEVLDQVSSFLISVNYTVKKGETLVIFTSLSKRKFLKVLLDLEVSYASVEFKRIGLFQKMFQIRF